MSIVLETSLGVSVVDLYTNERKKTALNFLKLCKLKYYNNCLFHSVQKGLVAQTGDPTGTGRGGESVFCKSYGDQAKYFDLEKCPIIKHTKAGLLSMVNDGKDQHGSQFFITLNRDLDSLDDKHTVFGEISEGFELVEKLNDVFCDKESHPFRNIRIHHTIVLFDPFDDPPGLDPPNGTPTYVPDIQLYTEPGAAPRLEEDENLHEEAQTVEQLEESQANQEERANAKLLTLIGDLPDADIKPPDNVLFVCKLNPVTTSEDLEIIFSRFGEILSCEVIRDKRSGNSLQYAFIEFKTNESCESAFFKMDNVVIDDRRIHVDFSQSVAKEWYNYKKGYQYAPIKIPPRDRRQRKDTNKRSSWSPIKNKVEKQKSKLLTDKSNPKNIIDQLINILEEKTADTDSSDSSIEHKKKKRKKEKKHKKKSKKKKD